MGAAALTAIVDAVFTILGICYGLQVLTPVPMTYLSEIKLPRDLVFKLVASTLLALAHATHLLLDLIYGTPWHVDPERRDHEEVVLPACHALLEMTAWGTSTALLWMEHRRSRPPSVLLRAFWGVNWLVATIHLFGYQRVAHMDLLAESTIVGVLPGLIFTLISFLGASCFFAPTTVSADLIELPPFSSPTAYLHSSGFNSYRMGYGTFGALRAISKTSTPTPHEEDLLDGGARSMLTDIQSTTAAMSMATTMTTEVDTAALMNAMNHADGHTGNTCVSAPAAGCIVLTIPTSTTSVWGKKHFVSFKVVVHTDGDRWSVRRQYCDFVALHAELPAHVKDRCRLPSDDSEHKYLSWKGRPKSMKVKLERFLRRVLSCHSFEPHSSQALCDFLELEYINEAQLLSLQSDTPSSPYSVRV